ncbi:DUF2809 domain-containing protein [Bacillus sp. 165]|uniref:ribosomal maturation YjgA family protein n=1 Tax=Bacillus sp. 165 TaxID=1529117 RepID=UPI001ADCC93C|nr:DUF2809 domain-containing protein [Bacillus sp. 165]MBO9128561.1 DUF2809 domain-containing protein [Bacillus sp. 165]
MYNRNRVWYAVMLIIVVVLGLGSRKMADVIHDVLDTYLGDALWGLMIFIGVGFLFKETQTKFVALIGLVFCYSIESTQLYHAAWLDAIRQTTLGGLVLGYGFLWSDLVAYTLGIGTGVVIELLYTRGKRAA